jgi:hypothetical protein
MKRKDGSKITPRERAVIEQWNRGLYGARLFLSNRGGAGSEHGGCATQNAGREGR